MPRFLVVILIFTTLTVPACPSGTGGLTGASPATPTVMSSADTTANSTRGLETPLPAPKLDPQGIPEYAFIADSRDAKRDPNDLQYEYTFAGHIYSLEQDPNSRSKIKVPLEAGRWALVLDDAHDVCAVAPVGEGGSLTLTLDSPGAIEFFFAAANTGYAASGPGNLNPCPPIYGGENPENYDFFPAGFEDHSPSERMLTFAPTETPGGAENPANAAHSGIDYPANPPPPPSIVPPANGIVHPADPSASNKPKCTGFPLPAGCLDLLRRDALKHYRLP
jgi:hypothetical protein